MNIMIVNRHMEDTLGGSEIQCDIIARYLLEFGHRIIYVAMNSNMSIRRNYQVISLERWNRRVFEKLLEQYVPDCVYWRFNKHHLLTAVKLCKKKKIKIIFSLSHINDVTKWTSNEPITLRRAIFRIAGLISGRYNYNALYLVDGVVSLNKDFLQKLPSRFNEYNCVHINNSMEFCPNKSFEWESPYVVWVANLKPPKRPELYIKLAKEFENSGIDFLMVGEIQNNKYKYVLDDNNTPANFYYLGFKEVHEVDAIVNGAMLLVHTCMPEGFGNIFIQAWLAGIPTVTLSFDPENLIENNLIGFCAGDWEHLAKFVGILIDDKDQREAMGERARNLAYRLFAPDVNVKKLEVFMNRILQD